MRRRVVHVRPQLYRANRPQKAVDLCMKYGQAWRAASLCGNRTWGDLLWTDDDSVSWDRAGNPFWFMWKNTCWALSDRKSPPAHVSPRRCWCGACGAALVAIRPHALALRRPAGHHIHTTRTSL